VKTCIFTSNSSLNHDTGQGHPECPERISSIIKGIKQIKSPNLTWKTATEADQHFIELTHSKSYVKKINASFPKDELKYLDGDTIISPGSKKAAYEAAGSIMSAIDGIFKKEFNNAFCVIRPPGHHAEKEKPMGFCIFNNVAVGGVYLIEKYKLNKIAIIDYDVHHGNGTQDIFYENNKVLYISSHQFPFYPGTGSKEERGKYDNIFNIPLEAGTSSSLFLKEYEKVYEKLRVFKPECILLSSGFDAHKDDPLANINLESKDFYTLTKNFLSLAQELCDGKLISILEGGYNLNAIQESAKFHVEALLGQ